MLLNLDQLKEQKTMYTTQKLQAEYSMHQLNGAIFVLDDLIKKMEEEQPNKDSSNDESVVTSL